jgi:hypothetical protein
MAEAPARTTQLLLAPTSCRTAGRPRDPARRRVRAWLVVMVVSRALTVRRAAAAAGVSTHTVCRRVREILASRRRGDRTGSGALKSRAHRGSEQPG